MTVKPIADCAVVILGGTAGVGLETAIHFAAQGARVALLGRDQGRGAAACKAVRDRVPAASPIFVQVDEPRKLRAKAWARSTCWCAAPVRASRRGCCATSRSRVSDFG